MLGREAVEDKSNEIGAIPALLKRLDLKGALVSVDAMDCNPATAEAITPAGADYLLAVKANQPTLHAEIAAYFDTAAGRPGRDHHPGQEPRQDREPHLRRLAHADWLNSAHA